MQIKRQSIAFNILNNFSEVNEVNSVDKTVDIINDNFNKGLIDELELEEAFEQLDNVIQKAAPHKYFKREGVPGNYKYYYTEAEYRAAKSKKSEDQSSEVIKKDGKKYKLQPNGKYLEVSDQHKTKEDYEKLCKEYKAIIVHFESVDVKMNKEAYTRAREVVSNCKYYISKLSSKEYTFEDEDREENSVETSEKVEESDSKLEHNIVDDVNNGEIINSLFKEWDSIRTTEQHEKWAKKVANTKFGTYKEKTILNVIDNFNPKFRNEIVKNDFLNEVKRAYDSYEEKTVESTKEDESLKEERKESDLDTFLVKMKKRVIDNHDNSPWEFPGSIKSATEKFANQFNLPVSDIGKLTEEGVLVISQEDKGTNRGGMFTSVKFDVNKLKSKAQ